MKNLFFALALGLAVLTPSFAFADIAPEPEWYELSRETEDAVEETTDVIADDVVTYEELASGDVGVIGFMFAVALYVSIIVETVAAAIALALMRRPLHSVVAVPIATLVTLPLFWCGMFGAAESGAIHEGNWVLALIVAEVVVIAVEAVILHALHPKVLGKRQALIVSAVMNIASVVVGFIVGMSG